MHRTPYPFSFQWFLCTEQGKRPYPTCIGVVMCRDSTLRHKTGTKQTVDPSCFHGLICAR